MKANRAFTLIELLVVISIIGMLASVVLVALNSTRSNAKNARIKLEVLQIRNLLESSFNGSQYPNLTGTINVTGVLTGRFEFFTPQMVDQIEDILSQNNLTYPASYSGNSYQFYPNWPSCSPVTADTSSENGNGLVIYVNGNSCASPIVPTTKYAIYAAYGPNIKSPRPGSVGSGYFCVDSSGKTISNNTTAEIPTNPSVPYQCQ